MDDSRRKSCWKSPGRWLAGLVELETERHLPRRREFGESAADGRRPAVLLLPGLRGFCGRKRVTPMPICCRKHTTAWRRSGSRPARRPTRPATFMHAVACGGRCFAVGRRWRAAPAWQSFVRPRRARFATCGVMPRTCQRRWRRRFRPASNGIRAAGRIRWRGWPPCSVRPRAAGRRLWPTAWPERPAHGPLDDHRAESPPIEPHSAVVGRGGVLFGGGWWRCAGRRSGGRNQRAEGHWLMRKPASGLSIDSYPDRRLRSLHIPHRSSLILSQVVPAAYQQPVPAPGRYRASGRQTAAVGIA